MIVVKGKNTCETRLAMGRILTNYDRGDALALFKTIEKNADTDAEIRTLAQKYIKKL